jgi:hypothetical protein
MEENIGSGKRGEQDRNQTSIHYSICFGISSLLKQGYSTIGVYA